MRRTSNLAVNRSSGLTIPDGATIKIKMDKTNPVDEDAIGIYLDSEELIVAGWLYRKDSNRPAATAKLTAGGVITGHIEIDAVGKVIVVFWL